MIDLSLSLDEVNKVLVALQTQSTDSMLLAQKIKQQGDSQTHDELQPKDENNVKEKAL